MAIQGTILDSCTELQKFIILSVHAEDDPIPDRTRLQHIMFMESEISDSIREQARYTFQGFGVYSQAVDKELDRLIGMGIISEGGDGIEATEAGRRVGRALRKNEDKHDMFSLCLRKNDLNAITDDELSSFFCLEFPEYAAKFSRCEELKPHFKDHLFSMLAKNKISSGKVAQLLNMDLVDVRKKTREMGLRLFW